MVGLRSVCGFFSLLFIVLLVVSSLTVLETASGSTITVPNDYKTIQEAINAAQDGNEIFIRAGTYNEILVVNKSISLIGENRETTVIDGSNIFGNVIEIVAENVTVANLTIQKALGYPYYESHGINIKGNSSGNTISNNIIKDNFGCGIYHERWFWLSKAVNNTIVGNRIINNVITGITIQRADNNKIINNWIENNGFGIYLDDSSHNVIEGNSIAGASYANYGIDISGGSNNLIFQNNISTTYFGINQRGSNNTISENTITSSQNGILLGNQYSTLNRNNIIDCYIGINMHSSNNNIHENILKNNSIGVVLWVGTITPAISNTFFHNSFVNNTLQVLFEGSGNNVNLWDNGKEGNYWSDYTGIDNNNNGVGDTPYIINGNNIDKYPLMKPYTLIESAPSPSPSPSPNPSPIPTPTPTTQPNQTQTPTNTPTLPPDSAPTPYDACSYTSLTDNAQLTIFVIVAGVLVVVIALLMLYFKALKKARAKTT